MAHFVRSAPPRGLLSWRRAKTKLSVVFQFQCAYCETTEYSVGSYRSFQVDHFRPKARAGFALLTDEWGNLYYACPDCNSMKNDFWPSAEQEAAGYTLIDPCVEDPFQKDIQRKPTGEPMALTARGRCMIEVFGFDFRTELQKRWAWREALALEIAEVEQTLQQAEKESDPASAGDVAFLRKRLRHLTATYELCFLGWDTRPKRKRQLAKQRLRPGRRSK